MSKELLLRMKEREFVFDTKIGQKLNKNFEEDKFYILKILDLLHENFDKVKFVDDLSSSVIGKKKWAVMVSEKFAMMDKRIPIPQVPFHIVVEGRNETSMKAKHAFYMLKGYLEEENEAIYVALNFRHPEYRKLYKELIKGEKIEK